MMGIEVPATVNGVLFRHDEPMRLPRNRPMTAKRTDSLPEDQAAFTLGEG